MSAQTRYNVACPCNGDDPYCQMCRHAAEVAKEEEEDSAAEKRLTIGNVLDELTYINYKSNRGYKPDITPERWEKVYGPQTQEMERRYQREIERKS